MKALARPFVPSFVPALLACALASASALVSAAQTDSRGASIISIRAEDGQEIKLYDKSYALVIGVSDYSAGWPKLPGVKEDVEAVARALERQGFRVTVVLNPDSAELDKSFKSFIDQYGQGVENRLLFYFAGHGHTLRQSYGDEMGYIVPADAPLPARDQAGFMSKAMDMQQMELYARRIQSKHALFVFDSCFSGSFFALSRAVPDSIGYKTARPVRQFITSGSADETVPDKSIFRRQFVEAIEGEADSNHDGYVTGTELGEYLQDKVVNYSRNAQHPQYGKIRNPNLDKGDFVFALPKALKPPPVAASSNPTPVQPASPAPVDPAAFELSYWNSIQGSADAEDFKDYLSKYPNGQFASIARRRVAALGEAAKPSPASPPAARPSPSPASAKPPIAKRGLINALKINGLSVAEMVQQIETRGVDFEMTADAEQELRSVGARPEVIEAARSNYRAPATETTATTTTRPANTPPRSNGGPPVPAGPPLSKNEIITMLRGGIASARVEQFVEARGVTFAPTSDVTSEIEAAGGDRSLVYAISEKAPAQTANNSNASSPYGNNPAAGGAHDYDDYIDRASSAYVAKDWNSAISYAQQAAQLDPSQSRAYQLLGTMLLYVRHDLDGAEQAMRAAIERGGSAVFHVYHDHDGNFGQYCQGSLFVTKAGVSFKADDGRDTFETDKSNIQEAKLNAYIGVKLGAFRIKPVQKINGRDNFNFAPGTANKAEAELIIKLIKAY